MTFKFYAAICVLPEFIQEIIGVLFEFILEFMPDFFEFAEHICNHFTLIYFSENFSKSLSLVAITMVLFFVGFGVFCLGFYFLFFLTQALVGGGSRQGFSV